MDNQSKEKLQAIASQLARPQGEKGIEIGQMMNETNIGMTLSAIESLNLASEDRILELGHGNCGHLKVLLSKADKLRYTGLEISDTMQQQAIDMNNELFEDYKIDFQLFDGNQIPFNENSFSKIFTVNTLYFWQEPLSFLKEIYRVLGTNGLFALVFAQKEFMASLPFTEHGFQLYDSSSVENLLNQTEFNTVSVTDYSEWVKSKTGEQVQRMYTVFLLSKNQN
ncbi:class I SAM-dependent methyltransferase [Sphingobacterium hungaricum]|uniref:Class I SAM-dependent methyltransferase n=1 Tax=Sphingobacterium hungaricum TaxID=2082723 RepID=A0A928UYS9_9SPHI|nr:class I SAM-dependent methyltransferase [Sphingobacterium hungaricum]MBE8715177.1 class I SAM-dependent methyltransferase [Sphingobacterium hungaricum]